MTAVRLLIDPPGEGAWNMAVDETLLLRAADEGIATLRFYQWSKATLSLGYFQLVSDRQCHAPSRPCPLVRRASGGGAIVHDRELTYSIAWPFKDRFAPLATSLYDVIHESIVNSLRRFQIESHRHAGPPSAASAPFLCFQRRAAGDVLLETFKIAGSAQRRHRGALLQHGSILLDQSPAAPELPGINQLAARPVGAEDLVAILCEEVCRTANLQLARGELTSREWALSQELQEHRFADGSWTFRRQADSPCR